MVCVPGLKAKRRAKYAALLSALHGAEDEERAAQSEKEEMMITFESGERLACFHLVTLHPP